MLGVQHDRDALLVTKSPVASWRDVAVPVEDAIRAEILDPLPGPASCVEPTAQAVEAVIHEMVGAVLAAHGGAIKVVDVSRCSIALALHGACAGCPGSSGTVDDIVITELRRRFSAVIDITVVRGRHRLWPVSFRRSL